MTGVSLLPSSVLCQCDQLPHAVSDLSLNLVKGLALHQNMQATKTWVKTLYVQWSRLWEGCMCTYYRHTVWWDPHQTVCLEYVHIHFMECQTEKGRGQSMSMSVPVPAAALFPNVSGATAPRIKIDPDFTWAAFKLATCRWWELCQW